MITMDNIENTVRDIICSTDKFNNLPSILDSIHSTIQRNTKAVDSITSDLVDEMFIKEIKLNINNITATYFGKTLREIKCVIIDEEGLRDHKIYFKYNGPKKIFVTSVGLPHTPLQDREYRSIEDIVATFRRHVNSLAGYFHELDSIDRYCTVMEPLKPTYKDNYRRILLDERTWLHVEVTPDGLATNIHLVGQLEQWQDKLQAGLLAWDHDKDIVENIMNMFDLAEFPVQTNKTPINCLLVEERANVEKSECCICLCSELPGDASVPQPLCQNSFCGLSFHRNCLFQWLVACSGGRPPTFGVATGSCPACLQTIACNEKDN